IHAGIDFRQFYFSNPFYPDYNLLDFNNNNNNQDEQNQFWSRNIQWKQISVGCNLFYDAFGLVSSCYMTSYTREQYQHGRGNCSSICSLELWRYQRWFTNRDCQWYRITYRYIN
ncbi:unnamed protein product, partial [Rotaria sordida]